MTAYRVAGRALGWAIAILLNYYVAQPLIFHERADLSSNVRGSLIAIVLVETVSWARRRRQVARGQL